MAKTKFLFSAAIALVFMSMSVYAYDEDLEEFELYESVDANEARIFGNDTSSLIPDG